jgi:flagellar assembly protein FliH
MVRHTAGTNPGVVLSTLATALKQTKELEILSIRLNPEDVETVAGYLEETPGMTGHLENPPLDTDPAIERGGCLVETASGVVDATHAHQFSTLREQFQIAGNRGRAS